MTVHDLDKNILATPYLFTLHNDSRFQASFMYHLLRKIVLALRDKGRYLSPQYDEAGDT